MSLGVGKERVKDRHRYVFSLTIIFNSFTYSPATLTTIRIDVCILKVVSHIYINYDCT